MSTRYIAKPAAAHYVRPVLATLALHGLMIYLMTVNWAEQRARCNPRQAGAQGDQRADWWMSVNFSPSRKPQRQHPSQKPKPVAGQAQAQTGEAESRPSQTAATVEPNRAKPEPRITQQELAAIARADLAEAVAAGRAAQRRPPLRTKWRPAMPR